MNKQGSKLIRGLFLVILLTVFMAGSLDTATARGSVQRVEYMTNSGEGVIPNLNRVKKIDIGGVRKLIIVESTDGQTRLVSSKGERVVSEFSSNKRELRVVGLETQELILYCSSSIKRLELNIMVDTLDVNVHSNMELIIQGTAAKVADINMLHRKSRLDLMMFETPRFIILSHKYAVVMLRYNRFTVGPNVVRNYMNIVEYVASPYIITRY